MSPREPTCMKGNRQIASLPFILAHTFSFRLFNLLLFAPSSSYYMRHLHQPPKLQITFIASRFKSRIYTHDHHIQHWNHLLSIHYRSHVHFQPASSCTLDLILCSSSPPTSQTPDCIYCLAIQITNLHSRPSHPQQWNHLLSSDSRSHIHFQPASSCTLDLTPCASSLHQPTKLQITLIASRFKSRIYTHGYHIQQSNHSFPYIVAHTSSFNLLLLAPSTLHHVYHLHQPPKLRIPFVVSQFKSRIYTHGYHIENKIRPHHAEPRLSHSSSDSTSISHVAYLSSPATLINLQSTI